MANNHDWVLTVVGDLLGGFGADPDASVLGLLTLGYGQPVLALLQTQWSDFDLHAGVWWVGGEPLPLTAPFVVLLKRFRRCCAGRGDRLFIGCKGRALGKFEANARVRELTREFFNLHDLLDLVPDMGAGQWAHSVEMCWVLRGQARSHR